MFYMVHAWKKDKNYNKGKLKIWWDILRDKDQFNFLMGLTKILGQ